MAMPSVAGRRLVRRRRPPAAVGRSSFFGRRFSGLVAIRPAVRWSPTASTAAFAVPAVSAARPVARLGLAFRSGAGVLLAALDIPPLIAA